jgi:hypothetical protein
VTGFTCFTHFNTRIGVTVLKSRPNALDDRSGAIFIGMGLPNFFWAGAGKSLPLMVMRRGFAANRRSCECRGLDDIPIAIKVIGSQLRLEIGFGRFSYRAGLE